MIFVDSFALQMVRRSPVSSGTLVAPSNVTSTFSILPLRPSPISITISSSEDRTMLLVFNACEQIGVITVRDAVGSTLGPPAYILYAVEPVGVEMMIPSAS